MRIALRLDHCVRIWEPEGGRGGGVAIIHVTVRRGEERGSAEGRGERRTAPPASLTESEGERDFIESEGERLYKECGRETSQESEGEGERRRTAWGRRNTGM
jgi:hypothetical protein